MRELLAAYLHRVVGPCEVVALGAAHDAARATDDAASARSDDAAAPESPERMLAADRRLHAVTLPREFRESSTTAGARLLELLDSTSGLPPITAALAEAVDAGETPGHFAVALGTYAAEVGLGRDAACLLHGYAFLSDQLGAAQRLGRFGHTAIQGALADLLEDVRALPAYGDRELEAMGSFAPLVDVAGVRHERAERRLFVS